MTPIINNVVAGINLAPGEQITWQGAPVRLAYFFKRLRAIAIGIIVFAALITWLMSLGLPLAASAVIGGVLGAILFLRFVVFRFGKLKANAEATQYIVTNLRVIVRGVEVMPMTGRSRIKIIELQLDAIKPILIGGNGATGTIKFGVDDTAFNDIPDAANVFRNLTISQPSRGATSQLAKCDTSFPLRLGEEVLWKSKPNFASFVCSESLVMITLVAVALAVPYLYNLIHNTIGWEPSWPQIGIVLAIAAIVSPILVAWRAASTEYFVTNYRVVITRKFTATSQKVTYREWPETMSMRLLRRGGNCGTIVFEKQYGRKRSVDEFSFIAIPEAASTFDLVRRTRETGVPVGFSNF
jgi:hypothetical protein